MFASRLSDIFAEEQTEGIYYITLDKSRLVYANYNIKWSTIALQ